MYGCELFIKDRINDSMTDVASRITETNHVPQEIYNKMKVIEEGLMQNDLLKMRLEILQSQINKCRKK